MDRKSIDELRKELQDLENTLLEDEVLLQKRRQGTCALAKNIATERSCISSLELSQRNLQTQFQEIGRCRQILENEGARLRQNSEHLARSEYVSKLMNIENKSDAVIGEVQQLTERIRTLQEKDPEAQKRLTIARLMTMLDDLQASLDRKVRETPYEEEPRAQKLLKAIQELSRERERALSLLMRREHEAQETLVIKNNRISELRSELDQSMGTLRESCEHELLGVIERIQKERNDLVNEIERLEETNAQLIRVIQDTKLSSNGAVSDRDTALSSGVILNTSNDVDAECKSLRERIITANAEKQRFMQQAEEIQAQMDEKVARYHEKIAEMKKEILLCQQESSKLEKENKAVKALCDALAAQLQ